MNKYLIIPLCILTFFGTMSLFTIVTILSYLFWPIVVASIVVYVLYQHLTTKPTKSYEDYD